VIELAYASPAALAIVPAQDVLGLGSEARMNRPGTARGNWQWRLEPGQLTPALAARLRGLAEANERL
jgi:4-alpha-glucanotransferase